MKKTCFFVMVLVGFSAFLLFGLTVQGAPVKFISIFIRPQQSI